MLYFPLFFCLTMYDHKTKKNEITSVSEYKIFIFGSKAKEIKTKERTDNFFSTYYSFLNSETGLKLSSQTYFCLDITRF